MTCSACANRVQKVLNRTPGVLRANVNLALERADVTVIAGVTDMEVIAERIGKAGYHAVVPTDGVAADEQQRMREEAQLATEKRTLIIASVLTIPMVLGMIFTVIGDEDLHIMPAAEVFLATLLQFVIGARFYKSALNALRGGSANMDVLVVLGTTSAYFYSWYLLTTLGEEADGNLYFEASAVIITLVLLGKYLESKAKRGTTAAIRQLMALRPETAVVKQGDGSERTVPIGEVNSGDTVVVRPGERIPVDGEIISGQAELDESLITGESLPIAKTAGDNVTGGAINLTGLLQVRATTVGLDSTLARIIKLVSDAQSGKATVQRLVDRISEIFVPAVIVIALLTFGTWLYLDGDFEHALIAAVSVLVIACPCALGLATPTAIMTGTGAAARSGILIKDVQTLENAHRMNTVVFDKTGTLTQGKPSVVGHRVIRGNETQTLRLAASVQQGSEHPLAQAILDSARALELELGTVGEFENLVGRGVRGVVEGATLTIGNQALIAEAAKLDTDVLDQARTWEAEGKTVVWLADAEGAMALFAIADAVRPQAADAVAMLKSMGVRTLMLSGDAPLVAATIGKQLDIDDARGAVKPDEKAAVIASMVDAGRVVGMIGDGVNDAPALAAADVGIAMGTGTDIAMETAGITLMRPDPRLVAAALEASRATFRKIKQNLFWAFVYNVVCIPLAAAGALTPTWAAAAMAMSSVSVVSNSLILRRWRPKFKKSRS